MKFELEIRSNSNLYFLINAFIGAYNRRTDLMRDDREAELNQLKSQLKDSASKLGSAIQSATKEK